MEQYSLAYVYNSLPKQCREIAALLFLLSINIAVNASELSFTLNTNGIDFLSYHGQTLASSGGMVIGVADFIEADGGSYQSNVISTIWLPMESNKVRVIVDWGSVSCVYTQYSDSINMTLTVSNSTINTMRVARIVVQYLSVPNASQTKVWTFDPGQFYGSEGPFTLGSSAYGAGGGYGIPLIHCEYQTGCFAIGQAVFPDTEEDVGNSDTYVMVSNVSNKLSCTVCIYYIAPGSVKTRNFCLRFAPSGTDPYIVPNYISDLFEKYNAFKPMVFQWDDRRPILGETTLANGTITNQNPRRYTTSYDLRTEAGKAAFRTQLLQRADTTISKMREGNAQGIIIWSIEGIERKESMYIGDPRRIEFAPEMEYKGTSTVATVDAFLKKFTDAGFRIGHCLRPRELVDKTYELGMQFKPLRNGVITRLRLRPSFQDRYDVHIARIWRNEDDVVIGGPYYLSFGGATYPGGSDDWMEFEIPDVEVFSNVEYTLSIALSTNGCCAFSYYPMNSTNWIDNGSNLMYRGGGVYSTNLGVRPTIVHSNF